MRLVYALVNKDKMAMFIVLLVACSLKEQVLVNLLELLHSRSVWLKFYHLVST